MGKGYKKTPMGHLVPGMLLVFKNTIHLVVSVAFIESAEFGSDEDVDITTLSIHDDADVGFNVQRFSTSERLRPCSIIELEERVQRGARRGA